MYRIIPILLIICTAEGANFQRYESTAYPGVPGYNTYSTMSNYPDQYQQSKYSDIATFPEATRYPNYNPGTSRYNSYGSYSTPTYGSSYNTYSTPQTGYGAGGIYSTQGYGSLYSGKSYSPYEMPFMRDVREYCVSRLSQQDIWVERLMGMWYGVEEIQHLAGDSSLYYAKTCIVLHIAEPRDRPSTENQLHHVQHINAKFRHEHRHLRLLWDEAGQTLEYALYFRNSSVGYWQSINGQNGSLARGDYKQFTGSVQVLKAVNDHLVLNFCEEGSQGRQAQLFTIVFSREPGGMHPRELDSVHNLLQVKKLSIASRRMVCGNSAGRPFYSLVLSFILFALTFLVASS